MDIQKELLSMQDTGYKVFQSQLIPNISADKIIGVRIPVLRKYVKTLKDEAVIEAFMRDLPHVYYEEDNVHAFLIERIKSYEDCVKELERFLPFVDNWATCDCMSPKILRTNKDALSKQAMSWMNREEEYAVRFGIKILMDVFLDVDFKEAYLYAVADLQREEYYIKMMQSWYLATALAKQYETVKKLLQTERLNVWVHNKAIQKALESRRITKEQKAEIKGLKR